MPEDEAPDSPAPERPRAVRLTIAYNGDQMELVSQQNVAMRVPPSDPVESLTAAAEEPTGYWVDLKDDQDQTLYRRLLDDPIPSHVEVFSPDPEQSMQRVPVAEPRGVISIVLPEIEAAQAVSLVGPPTPSPESPLAMSEPEPVRELARFDLKPKP